MRKWRRVGRRGQRSDLHSTPATLSRVRHGDNGCFVDRQCRVNSPQIARLAALISNVVSFLQKIDAGTVSQRWVEEQARPKNRQAVAFKGVTAVFQVRTLEILG